MFQKKEYLFSESLGPCQVEDIVKLSAHRNAEPVLYYVLRSVGEKRKVSYIPVENHRSLLRPLIGRQEALQIAAAGGENGLEEKRRAEAAFVLERTESGREEKA